MRRNPFRLPGLPPEPGRAVAAVRRVLTPVTSVGSVVLTTALVSWIAAAVLDWEELGRIAVIAAVVMVLAVAFTFGKAQLSVSVQLHPQRVVVGQRAAGKLQVTNVGKRRTLGSRIELPVGVAVARFEVPSLAGGASHDELFVVPTQRRAVIAVGPASSVRGDPLGLLRAEVPLTGVEDIYVHPVTARLEQLGTGFLRDLEGHSTEQLSPSDVAFHTLREYVPGDDRRHIHWKTSARTGTLMVRQFVDTRRSHLAIGLSGAPKDYASEDEFELAVSLAASLAVRTIIDEQDVTVVATGARISTVSGQRLLDGFSGCDLATGNGDLSWTAIELTKIAPDASVAVFCCGSTRPLADVRTDMSRYSIDVRQYVMRAQPGAKSNLTQVGELLVMTVGALDDLARLLFAAGQR
jgi:hypothetical protein